MDKEIVTKMQGVNNIIDDRMWKIYVCEIRLCKKEFYGFLLYAYSDDTNTLFCVKYVLRFILL